MTEPTHRSGRGRPSKVAGLIDEYHLHDLGDEMVDHWTAEVDRWSLRDLSTYFNQKLLEVRLKNQDVRILDGELANTYRLLTEDDVGTAERTRTRRRLEREGVDVDALLDDFVSYQAIRNYLTSHRGVEHSADRSGSLNQAATNIEELRGRLDSVTQDKLDRLRNSNDFSLGEFRMLIDVRVVCETCNTQYDVLELLDAGGCDCS